MSPGRDQGLPSRFVDSIGVKLRKIRQQLQLSLREVEEHSLRFAREQGDQSYEVSASWLARLEREDHELTVNKLIAFAYIYNISAEELLRSTYPPAILSLF